MKTKNIEVIEILKRIQKGYDDRNIDEVENFVEDVFTKKDGIVFLGTDLGQWAEDHKGISEIIKKQWTTNDETFGKVDFNFEEADVFESGEILFVASKGTVNRTIEDKEVISKGAAYIREVVEKDTTDEMIVYTACRKIAETLSDLEMGSTYTNPIRFMAMFVKEEKTYKCYQMQFSFDGVFLWPYRYDSKEEVKSMMEMRNRTEESSEIRKVLEKFQEGYIKRDESYLDEFTKIFTMDEDMITIGTDVDEICRGPEELKEILEGDWEYWGDFRINIDGAVIVEKGDTAFFTTKAMISSKNSRDRMTDSAVALCKMNMDDEEIKDDKTKMIEALKSMMTLFHELERGEDYFAPMRFSGLMVKRDGQWLLHNLQYSDYTRVPEKRI